MKLEKQERIPILVIGAGPHALCFVTKFLEASSDPFEETPLNDHLFRCREQTIQYRFTKGLRQLRSERDGDIWKKTKCSVRKCYTERIRQNVRILDEHGEWMHQWESQFDVLGIQYLRSGTNAHLDPISWESLRLDLDRRADRKQATQSLEYLLKSDTYHGPFEAPSTKRFECFTKRVVARYNLENAVEQGTVVGIDRKDDGYFARLSTGETIAAARIVLAIGSQRLPAWPAIFLHQPIQQALYHSSTLLGNVSLMQQLTSTCRRVLIVGGGLTAAHLALRFAAKGCMVTLASRNELKIRQFDLGLEWMGSKRGKMLAQFWSEKDFHKRLSILKQSKNGGSITPEVYHQLHDRKNLKLREECQVYVAEFVQNEWKIEFTDSETPSIYDAVICATGTKIDATQEPLLSQFLSSMELIDSSFPVLTSDLRLAPDIDVHLLGEYAALQLGPGAVNLMGARAGAARVVKSLK